jgi:hypothetical protein
MNLIEEIDLANLKVSTSHTAVAEATELVMAKLIEGRNPIYKIRDNHVLFGYSSPPSGIVFSKLSKDQSVAWFNTLTEGDDDQPSEDGACEVYEVTPYQWDKLAQIARGEQVERDSDTEWLQRVGLITVRDSGNLQTTPLGRDWTAMLKP